MRPRRLLVSSDAIDEGQRTARLRGDVLHHVTRVLRLGVGARLVLLDGDGVAYDGSISEITPASAVVCIDGRNELALDPGPRMTLIHGLARGSRTEIVLQKATELGVDRMLPALCARSVARPRNLERKRERWLEIVRQSARQSQRPRVPQVAPVEPLAAVLSTASSAQVRLVAVVSARRHLGQFADVLAQQPAEVAMAVGPEGGFTSEELQLAYDHGFEPVSLGPLVLRTETAAVALLAIVAHLAGRLRPTDAS